MKLRSAMLFGLVTLCFAANSCTSTNTPAATPSNQAQATPEAAPQTSPSPAAAATPELSAAKDGLRARSPEPGSSMKESPPPAPPVIVPAGTVLSVRVNQAIGSSSNKAGEKFTASLTEPVVSKGQTLVPSRSVVTGVIDKAQQGGKIKGSSVLSLHLVSLTVNGVSYPISTGSFLEQGKGKGSRTAKIGAGGAAAGAVIGGIAGGGKGALIGGLAGGGAGVAGSAFTGNKELTIPAEAVLQFKLAQPVRLAGAGNTSKPASNATQQ